MKAAEVPAPHVALAFVMSALILDACATSQPIPPLVAPISVVPAVYEAGNGALWQPTELRDPAVQVAVVAASKKYGLPRWFYYAVIHRESTFNRCKVQDEGPPGDSPEDGRGLTQLSFGWYNGWPYPHGNAAPNDADPNWRANMGLGVQAWRGWISMADVTTLEAPRFRSQAACLAGTSSTSTHKVGDAFDPTANLDRFSSGYAASQYMLRKRLSPNDAPATTLRKVAYYWHYGLWGSRAGDYPTDPRPYLPAYDGYVAKYRGPVEAEDGVYAGGACSPPYVAAGCAVPAPAPAPVPTPPPPVVPPTKPALAATLRKTADWTTGYCVEVALKNETTAPVAWKTVVVDVGDGRVRTGTSVWGGAVTGKATFASTAQTSLVKAGEIVNVGFCADRGASKATASFESIAY